MIIDTSALPHTLLCCCLGIGLVLPLSVFSACHNGKDLREAVSAWNLNRMRELLASGTAPDAIDGNTGQTSLHVAYTTPCHMVWRHGSLQEKERQKQTVILTLFCHTPFDRFQTFINQCDYSGNAALHYAVNCPGTNDRFVNLLLGYGANPSIRNNITGNTPLHLAQACSTVSLLLSYGANPFSRNVQNLTPAEYGDHPEHNKERAELLAQAKKRYPNGIVVLKRNGQKYHVTKKKGY